MRKSDKSRSSRSEMVDERPNATHLLNLQMKSYVAFQGCCVVMARMQCNPAKGDQDLWVQVGGCQVFIPRFLEAFGFIIDTLVRGKRRRK